MKKGCDHSCLRWGGLSAIELNCFTGYIFQGFFVVLQVAKALIEKVGLDHKMRNSIQTSDS